MTRDLQALAEEVRSRKPLEWESFDPREVTEYGPRTLQFLCQLMTICGALRSLEGLLAQEREKEACELTEGLIGMSREVTAHLGLTTPEEALHYLGICYDEYKRARSQEKENEPRQPN